jgi:hypothetical protein
VDTDEKVSLISSSFMAPPGSLMRVAYMERGGRAREACGCVTQTSWKRGKLVHSRALFFLTRAHLSLAPRICPLLHLAWSAGAGAGAAGVKLLFHGLVIFFLLSFLAFLCSRHSALSVEGLLRCRCCCFYIVLDAMRCSVMICYLLLFSVGIFDFVSGLHLSLLKVLWFFLSELFYVICFRTFSLDTSIRFSRLPFGGRIGEAVKSRFSGGFCG